MIVLSDYSIAPKPNAKPNLPKESTKEKPKKTSKEKKSDS